MRFEPSATTGIIQHMPPATNQSGAQPAAKKTRGVFITLEGPDGCGKTTQSKILAKRIERETGRTVVWTREPGGTDFGNAVRKVLLDPQYLDVVSPRAELLLYQAIRAQHVDQLIVPAVHRGDVVICDRFIDASTAYQGYGRGLGAAVVGVLNQIATDGHGPARTILLDCHHEVGLQKANSRPGGADRLELAGPEFHQRVRDGYHRIAEQNPSRVTIVQRVDGDIEATAQAVWAAVQDLF